MCARAFARIQSHHAPAVYDERRAHARPDNAGVGRERPGETIGAVRAHLWGAGLPLSDSSFSVWTALREDVWDLRTTLLIGQRFRCVGACAFGLFSLASLSTTPWGSAAGTAPFSAAVVSGALRGGSGGNLLDGPRRRIVAGRVNEPDVWVSVRIMKTEWSGAVSRSSPELSLRPGVTW